MDKSHRYQNVLNTSYAVLQDYPMDMIGRMAIISSILKTEFSEWIFCGFYRVVKPNLLEIGPYQGNLIACGQITFGRGVCGAAATNKKSIIVDDVSSFPDYIACDDQTISEIVVPIIKNDKLIAILDIDGGTEGQFDTKDQSFLEELVTLI